MVDVIERVNKCAEKAALDTGTSVETEFITASHDKLPNKVLAEILHKNLVETGSPQFAQEEQDLVKEMEKI